MSVDDPPLRVSEACDSQLSEPPLTVGALGSVRSMLTVLPAVAVAGAQAELLPALSSARNWTSVCPVVLMTRVAPAVAADQVVPPLVEVRDW